MSFSSELSILGAELDADLTPAVDAVESAVTTEATLVENYIHIIVKAIKPMLSALPSEELVVIVTSVEDNSAALLADPAGGLTLVLNEVGAKSLTIWSGLEAAVQTAIVQAFAAAAQISSPSVAEGT